MSTLGQSLKELRCGQSFSLRALARRSGVSQATLSRWEQGLNKPRIPELMAVVAALGASEEAKKALIVQVNEPRSRRRFDEDIFEERGMFVEVAGPPPTAGDLLRTIRHRSGRMLEQLGPAGVSPAAVSRWENMKSWPSLNRMTSYCDFLRAYAKETVFLTSGRYPLLGSALSKDMPKIEVLEERLSAISAAVSFVCDLDYFSLWADVWPLAHAEQIGCQFLARVLVEYSGFLVRSGRSGEAGKVERKANELAIFHL